MGFTILMTQCIKTIFLRYLYLGISIFYKYHKHKNWRLASNSQTDTYLIQIVLRSRLKALVIIIGKRLD